MYLKFSVLIGVLVAVACFTGVYVPGTYSLETVSWGVQGSAQDVVSLYVAIPLLLLSGFFAGRSLKAFFIWVGVMLYLAYSYVLYSFFIHFGILFPVYVAVMGLSAYGLMAALSTVDRERIVRSCRRVGTRAVSVYLFLLGLMFCILWISDIAGALLSGTVPVSVTETGLIVNPVHVLDLSLVLPGMMITGILLRRKRPIGYLFTAPLLTFSALMGLAIIAMQYALEQAGVSEPSPVIYIFSVVVAVDLLLLGRFLKGVGDA